MTDVLGQENLIRDISNISLRYISDSGTIKIIESSYSDNSEAYKKRIIDLINKWNLLLDGYTDDYKIKIENNSTLSRITDSLSSSMVSKASDRQLLLEELDESVRAEKIIEVLESRIEILSGKIETPDSDSTLIN